MNIDFILVLPLMIPLITAVLTLLLRNNLNSSRIINIVASIANLLIVILIADKVISNGIISTTIGSWQIPFGISLVADIFSSIMLLVSGIIFLLSSIYSIAMIDRSREKYGYYPLVMLLMMGINGSFLTGDLFNLFVWFEVMLISSFVLLALGGKKEQLEGAIKYVTLNLIASVFFLSAVGIIYGMVGTLNMADIAQKIPHTSLKGLTNVVAMFFLVSFGIKSAIFPLFFWLPASYHTPHPAISALLAGLLTKVGVYAIYRTFSLIFIHNIEFTHTLLLIIAAMTMVVGVLGPVAQLDFRRILSFHIVGQVGYMIMAFALFTEAAIAGGIFYIVHHIFVKTNLFMISGAIEKMKGSMDLERLGGVYKAFPLVGLLFLISALALAGIPPFSGFWAKFLLVKAGFEEGQYFVIAVSLFVGLLTLFSMIKIWNYVFWKDQKLKIAEAEKNYKESKLFTKVMLFSPIVIMTLIVLTLGFYMEPIYKIALKASQQLMSPEYYINSVIGGNK